VKFLAFSILGALSALGSANLLQNGSFEDGSFSPNGDNTMSLYTGATDMTGWTVTGDSLAWIADPNPFGDLTASDGSKSLDLTDYPIGGPYGGVEQTFATTANSVYTVSFKLGTNPLYSPYSEIMASADATTVIFGANAVTSQYWYTCSFQFVADDSSATLSLIGTNGTYYVGLDEVSVTEAVPEPASLAVLGLGLAAIKRRRR
jgi:hypothetical protein